MKKILFALLAISLIVLMGCATQKAVDCGIDEDCFLENLAKCAPAKMMAGLGDQIQFEISVKGPEGDSCVIHYFTKENPMPMFKDTEMDCKVPLKAYTVEEYEAYFQENLLTMCQGTYIDAMQSLLTQ